MLAPAAGHLASGVPLDAFGPEVDPAGLVPGVVSLPEADAPGAISGEGGGSTVSATASSTSIPRRCWRPGTRPWDRVELRFTDSARSAVGAHVRRRQASELVVLVDSYGLLSVALDRESAAARSSCVPARPVTVVPQGVDVGLASPVRPSSADAAPGARSWRPGTTIALVILLVLILGAAAAQFVLKLGP